MVETSTRNKLGERRHPDGTKEWEVFVRDAAADPLRHVGSVVAPSAEIAHEQASKLFGWYAQDIWICPVDTVHRYSTHDLDDGTQDATTGSGNEDRRREL